MRIKRIHLTEYKRFHDLTIDLGENPARIVALVGPNGCGKSSVFDAVLYRLSTFGPIGNNQVLRDYKYHSLLQNPAYSFENVRIDLDTGDFYQVMMSRLQGEQYKKMVSFRSSYRYNSSLNVKEIKAVSDISKNDFGASNASDIDQRIEQSYRRLFVKYNDYLNQTDSRPSEARNHIIGELNNSIRSCLSLEIDGFGNVEAGKGTFFFRKPDTPNPFEYNVLSSGEKEVLDILLDLYLRRDEYNDSIYIIDEPELHLNTSIQRSLISEINNMVPDNCQIWIATHSIGFLRALQDELKSQSQIIEFKAENNWASKEYVLSPIECNRTTWQNVFSTALDDLSSLIAPQRIVYCEGRAEPGPGGSERGLDATVYNSIFNSKYPDTLFISSGGNTELDQRSSIGIILLSKVFPDVEILVLKDRDIGSGKFIDDKQRQLCLNNNQHYRILKRYEIENYLYDKEVLIEYCRNIETQFDQASYDLKINDIVNQDVKEQTGIFKNLCGIKTNVNPEVFKKNLAKCITEDMSVYKELEDIIFYQL